MIATVTRARPSLVAVLVLVAASGAFAFHQQTPEVVRLTPAGDTDLPRIPPQGRRAMVLALAAPGGQTIAGYLPFTHGDEPTILAAAAGNAHPAVSFKGRSFAWDTDADPLGSGAPGRQVVVSTNGMLTQVAVDPTGTSMNPSLDTRGTTIVFESQGDLAGTGEPPGPSRVFVRDRAGLVSQMSVGRGMSRRAMISARRELVAFESTADPATGADTGTFQIWVGRVPGPAAPITAGRADSTDAQVSDRGHLVAFLSRADLAGDGHDTGAAQVFVWDVRSETYAQLTAEPAGCARPAVARIRRDWRVAFVCGGEAYYHMLREDRRYHVPTPGGAVQSMVPDLGVHFVTLSTTADLLDGGTTAGHRIYLVNLFKRAAVAVPGSATWFPYRGVP